jgi:hypothetical protein
VAALANQLVNFTNFTALQQMKGQNLFDSTHPKTAFPQQSPLSDGQLSPQLRLHLIYLCNNNRLAAGLQHSRKLARMWKTRWRRKATAIVRVIQIAPSGEFTAESDRRRCRTDLLEVHENPHVPDLVQNDLVGKDGVRLTFRP